MYYLIQIFKLFKYFIYIINNNCDTEVVITLDIINLIIKSYLFKLICFRKIFDWNKKSKVLSNIKPNPLAVTSEK